MRLFKQNNPENQNDREIKIQFVRNIYTAISTDRTMSPEIKQQILLGALIHAGLSAKDVIEEIQNIPR